MIQAHSAKKYLWKILTRDRRESMEAATIRFVLAQDSLEARAFHSILFPSHTIIEVSSSLVDNGDKGFVF